MLLSACLFKLKLSYLYISVKWHFS